MVPHEDVRPLLQVAVDRAAEHLATLDDRPVRTTADVAEMRRRLVTELPDDPDDPRAVIDELADAAEPGLMPVGSPRFFGFVIGGTLPAAIAADWLTSAWDQNAGLAAITPAVATLEEIAGAWILELLGLPAHASFALVTGTQMAHVTAFAAARHRVLERAGWDVGRRGLAGAPPVRVLATSERHVTVDCALRLLGLGTDALEPI